MGADIAKKQKMVEKAEEEIGIDGKLVMSVEKLQEIQDELEKINEKASDEVLEIEQKYGQMRQPVYDRRNDVIKAIPDFWLTAFLSHPVLGELLTDEDHKIFKFLSSVEVEESKDVKSGYTITFNFNKNPYFENTKLSKTYTFLEDGPTKITASAIQWTEGKGIPNGVTHEKKGNKRPLAEERIGQEVADIHIVMQTLNCFFSWFSEVNQKDDGEDDGDVFLEIQDEVAEIIKDDLWPNPLTYFNNDPDEEDDEDGDEDVTGSSRGNNLLQKCKEKDSEGSDDDEDQDDDEEDGDE
ncbi:hypothetical protein RND71_029587 [Anisodus tanguticus]|uniref:Uncharacterized protein n=1 Tax=Anisodus tanguticus TaxID=243964 RepID=A0AAE1V6F8_9SOLA|nr:hypothetical protein RND71_029587 [Anisodus tanguticus]